MSGLLDISAAAYHAEDEFDGPPCLSASIANVLLSKSPAHAFVAHPRLNPDYQRDDDPKYEIGTAAHALFLEGRDVVEIIAADDWRTAVAKEARDFARAHGRIPLLAKQWEEVTTMVDAARSYLERSTVDPPMFTDGAVERTLLWDEDGVACKARLDWLRTDLAAIDDYKTSHDAHHDRWTRGALYSNGYDVQAAFYVRACQRIFGATPTFRWLIQEKTQPHAISIVIPDVDVLAFGTAKVEYAIRTWRQCMESGQWPAYSEAPRMAELPAWEESRWLERLAREEA